jgi:hypothetical protein
VINLKTEPYHNNGKSLSPTHNGKSERSSMFEKSEMAAELHARLKEAGLNPLDPNVQAINAVVSGYYAEKTAKVLQQVQEVLNRLSP